NRLNEVVKVLTSMATVLLVLTVVTGFFGQNWKFIPYDSEPLFFASLIFMVVVAVGTAFYFRRKGWLSPLTCPCIAPAGLRQLRRRSPFHGLPGRGGRGR